MTGVDPTPDTVVPRERRRWLDRALPPGWFFYVCVCVWVAWSWFAFESPAGSIERQILQVPMVALGLAIAVAYLVKAGRVSSVSLTQSRRVRMLRWGGVPFVVLSTLVVGGADLRLRWAGDPRFGDHRSHERIVRTVIADTVEQVDLRRPRDVEVGYRTCSGWEVARRFQVSHTYVTDDWAKSLEQVLPLWRGIARERGWTLRAVHARGGDGPLTNVYMGGEHFSFALSERFVDDVAGLELWASGPCTRTAPPDDQAWS